MKAIFYRLALLLSMAMVMPGVSVADQSERPNILFCLADDWMWPHAGCYGDKVVHTPNFDRVARQGVLFENAFVSSPSCTPSRGAILTGQWHWRLEEGANLHSVLSTKFKVYPDLLEDSGYFVGYTGKGWSPGSEGERRRNPAGPRYGGFKQFLAKRPAGKPFCFWFGSVDPHRPYDLDSGVAGGLKPSKVKVPPYLPDCETVRKDICDYYWEVQRFDRDLGEVLAELEKTGEAHNTIIVVSGDNGWPFPRGKANVYDAGTHAPLAICWPDRIKPRRTIQDFVSLCDLAPTFMEAAGLKPAPSMTARSLMPILLAKKSGQVDKTRDHVLTGMERHTASRAEPGFKGGVGYPTRALRTERYLFIRNFKPERWPAGDPDYFKTEGDPNSYEAIATKTGATFSDADAGPTKAWIVVNKGDPKVKPFYDLAFAKRPARELYDLKKDPFQIRNVAENPKYAKIARELEAQLMEELTSTADPRAVGTGDAFDAYRSYRK